MGVVIRLFLLLVLIALIRWFRRKQVALRCTFEYRVLSGYVTFWNTSSFFVRDGSIGSDTGAGYDCVRPVGQGREGKL